MPTLEFTTMVGCPLMCTFCPQPTIKAAYRGKKYMSLVAFTAILSKIPKHVRIDFSGMAEPWANPATTQMLRHCLEGGYHVAIYTTLYGMGSGGGVAYLLRKYAPQIDILVLHLPDSNGNMTGWKYDDAYRDALVALSELAGNELRGKVRAMTMDGGGKVHPMLWDVVQNLEPWTALDRAGNVEHDSNRGAPMTGPFRHQHPVHCSFTREYDQNVVLPNGDVFLCCMDYGLQHKLGNLLKQDYETLFRSPALDELKGLNARAGYDPRSLCKNCERAV